MNESYHLVRSQYSADLREASTAFAIATSEFLGQSTDKGSICARRASHSKPLFSSQPPGV